MRRVVLLAMTAFIAALPLAAQTWVKPAATPNTDVKCTTCPDTSKDKLTVGYPTALTTFVGRYLDSDNVNDFQDHFRTARARNVLVMPAFNRLYFIIGSAVFVYDIDRFVQRLAANEQLADVGVVPVPWDWRNADRLGVHETFLLYDQYFYAEYTPNGWITPRTDGQERLYAIDVDDQRYVYMAYTVFGWGIAKDEGKTDGALMTSQFQDTSGGTRADDVQPNMIAAVKGSTGGYYAIVSDATTQTLNIWDVTNREQPSRLPSVKKSMVRFVKTPDMTRIALVTTDGKLEIYNSGDLVVGGAALVSTRGPGNSDVRGVATDGTNFFIASDVVDGLTISIYVPDGTGYKKLADFPTTRPTLSTLKLQYADGYLVQSGITDGTYDLRMFKVSNFQVTEVPVNRYFQKYYVANGTAGYTAPKFGAFYDSAVVKRPAKSYLVVTGYGLGDVYEVPSSGSIGITNQGSVGHVNANRPSGGAAGPFYGDPIGFTAATTGNAQMNIQWDFGNPEAAAIAADPNTVNGVTGAQTTHRYSGLTSATQLPATRTVKATSLADANVAGAIGVTLAGPSVAVGLAGRSGVVTQAAQLASLPIVAGDKFIDASDGSLESHFDTWTLGGTATKALPNESVAVGTCAASRTFSLVAHYGPYSGTSPNLSSLSDLPLGIESATYSVRPFAPAITMTPAADSITFTGTSRVTTDTTVLSAAQVALQYKWELRDANNQLLLAGPSGAGAILPFTVAKTQFTSRGIRAHLILTSPTPAGGACAGLGMESADGATAPLNGPDPLLNGGCAADGAPPCSFTVSSASSVDPVADGWTYLWSVTPNNIRTTNMAASTFAPAFTQDGTYTVSVTVSNAVGSKSVQKSVTAKAGSFCPPMGNNVFVSYQSASGSCSHVGGSCSPGETIYFTAGAFGYDYACDTHTFRWDFGDGRGGTGKSLTHSYIGGGTFTVSLTITNPGETVTVTAPVMIGPPPPPCATMVANANVFPTYSAPSGCTPSSSTPCAVGEAITFGAGASGYNFSCATHTFTWNFGDGKTATTSSTAISHTYATSQIYNVGLTISNGTQTVSMSMPVKVSNDKQLCPTIVPNVSVFIAYAGPSTQCSHVNTTECSNDEDVAFYAAAAFDYDFGCAEHTFQWDFNDGTPLVSGKTAAHRFAGAGQYNVKLMVTVNGTTTTMNQTVKVIDVHPITECLFDFTVVPRVVNGAVLPDEYLFTVVPKKGATSASYAWDFGDGTTVTSNTLTQTHAYADSEPHTVTLTVPSTPCRVQHIAMKPRRRAAGR